MVKEIEKAGFPIVQMCNLIPVAKTVGANRIVPTIPFPSHILWEIRGQPRKSSGSCVITGQRWHLKAWHQISANRPYSLSDPIMDERGIL